MKYENMKKQVFAKVIIHDRAPAAEKTADREVGVAYYNGQAYYVAPEGYFPAAPVSFGSSDDVITALNNKPSCFDNLVSVVSVTAPEAE